MTIAYFEPLCKVPICFIVKKCIKKRRKLWNCSKKCVKMIRCAGLSGLRKIPGDVCYPFFLGNKNVHIFTRFDCLLSSSLGAVKSLPDFNVKSLPDFKVKISSMWDDGIFEHPRATPIISKCRWLFPVGSGLKSSKIQRILLSLRSWRQVVLVCPRAGNRAC